MVDPTDGLQYQNGLGYSALDAQAERSKLDGYAVVTGLTPTAGASGLTVDVAAGSALVGTDGSGTPLRVSNGGGSVTLSAADSALPRKDTVWIDDTGTLQVAEGAPADPLTENATQFNTFQPEPPVVVDGTVLAEVWVAAGATSLSAADVRDRRQPADVVASEVASESVSTGEATIGEVRVNKTSFSFSNAVAEVPLPDVDRVEFRINTVSTGSLSTPFICQLSDDGGASYYSAGDYAYDRDENSPGDGNDSESTDPADYISLVQRFTSSFVNNPGLVTITKPQDGTQNTKLSWQFATRVGGRAYGGGNGPETATDYIRFGVDDAGISALQDLEIIRVDHEIV